MKKYNIRTIAFSILIIFSLFSYTYVSCASVTPSTAASNNQVKEVEEANIYMPDITLVKKLIRLGEKVIK